MSSFLDRSDDRNDQTIHPVLLFGKVLRPFLHCVVVTLLAV
jgi:hypothetical protein